MESHCVLRQMVFISLQQERVESVRRLLCNISYKLERETTAQIKFKAREYVHVLHNLLNAIQNLFLRDPVP